MVEVRFTLVLLLLQELLRGFIESFPKTLSQVGKFLDGTTADAPAALAEVGFNQWYEDFAVATVHRAANTDDPSRLSTIIAALGRLPYPVLMPLHLEPTNDN